MNTPGGKLVIGLILTVATSCATSNEPFATGSAGAESFALATVNNALFVAVPAGAYDLTVSGVAERPTTTLTVAFVPAGTGVTLTEVDIDLDFGLLGADPGDVATGSLASVVLPAGMRTEISVPVAWSGALVETGPTDPFPLRVSGAGRYVEDAFGDPFLFHGDAPWSLIVQLTVEEAETYLADRASLGVQVVMVNLIEHEFADDPPNNAYGEAPFTTPGDFTTPNEAYFSHADAVLQLARDYGIAVMLFPAYVGYGGGSQGWWVEMSGQTEAQCRTYGQFVGTRYRDMQNIVWVSGGDYEMPVGSDGEACAVAIRDAILTADTDALHTTHYARFSTSLDQPTFAGSVDVNGVYSDSVMYPAVRDAWSASSLPIFMIEGYYENENGSVSVLRAQSWWAMTSGAMGQIAGNNPIWFFGSGWESALSSPLFVDLSVIRTAFDGWEWWRLEPDLDGTFLVGGADSDGSPEYATATLADDGSLGIVYMPSGGGSNRTLTVDLSRMSGAVTASWLDPTSGDATAIGSFGASGEQDFSAPGSNSSGSGDWVLVLEIE